MDLDWLDKPLAGEPAREWIMALLIAGAALLFLAAARWVILHRVGRIAAKTETEVDDFLVEVTRRTRWLLIVFPILSMSVVSLDLPRFRANLKTAAILAFLLQLAIWALVGINFWVESYRRRRLASDAASATMIAAFSFVGKVVLWTVILLLALDNLGVDVTALIAGLGVGGVAVALALQNILGDLFASLSIVLDKPFVIGDTIQVDTFVGTVETIGLKTTHLRSVSGEQLVFSNGDLLRSRIRNHKRMAERRVVLSFGVAHGTPPDQLARVPEILRGLVEAQDLLRFERAHFTGMTESALLFEMVYFVLSSDYKAHMDRQQAILLGLLRRLEADGIELASPARTTLVLERGPEPGPAPERGSGART